MATRLSAGGGGSSRQSEMQSFNIATGEAPAPNNTNLSGRVLNGTHTMLSQAEYFADEMILGELEKHEVMGVRVTRRISLAIVVCFCVSLIALIALVSKAVFGGSDEDKAPKLTQQDGLERYGKILNMLEPITGGAIAQEGTPEERALQWLAYQDPAQLDPNGHIDYLVQRFVLATLWEGTEGYGWANQYNFRSHYDVCIWNEGSTGEMGAYCNRDGFVEKLVLSDNELNGPLPLDIGLLTHLIHLDLKDNQLKEHMPSSFGMLHKLTHLDLSDNHMTGFAPENAQKLTSLQNFYLQNNRFQGDIPYEYLVDLPAIRNIDLSHNEFNGIQREHFEKLWGMDNVKSLDISHNKFEGPVPPYLRRISSLESLDMSYNGFTGTIPWVYSQMKMLEEFDVSYNKITGSIPAQFGDTSDPASEIETLEVFRASGNNLVGRIPANLGNYKNLGILMLDDNGLEGEIPSELGQLSELEILTLDKNDLVGTIPTELGRCRALEKFKASDNRLDGRLPTEIGEIEDLQFLDLRNNLLEGPLPPEVKNLSELTELQITGNNFIGDLDELLCDRPSLYPAWLKFESDCLKDLLTCTCCSLCCDDKNFCCEPGSTSCNDA